MPDDYLSAEQAAALLRLPLARFRELCDAGHYPPGLPIDPDEPTWSRRELLRVVEAREEARMDAMRRAGLLAETDPAPTGRRVECTTGSAKAAGELCTLLTVYGAEAYRAGHRDFRVYVRPKPKKQTGPLLRQLNAQHPELSFFEVPA
jgi:hypothetical protein